MAERIITGYKRLFEVRLLHHYWLDDGATIFDTLPEIRKNKLLLTYDCRSFFEVNPTSTTSNRIKALRGVFKKTSLGFLVAVPKSVLIPDDEFFSFVLTIKKGSFFNYTALTLLDRNIVERYYQPEDTLYRYKENVAVFSNLTGSSRGIHPNKSLFLSQDIPASSATDRVEFLNVSAGALVQLTSSQPGATKQQISAVASGLPVFVNQNDSPAIVPPIGLTGVPEKGILLSSEIPDNVFGLIKIAANNPVNSDFNCTSSGVAKESTPIFQIRFKNRSAIWRYLNKNTGATVSESAAPLPLTFSGNAGVKRKPGESFIKVKFENDDPAKRIEKIYTEIFD